MVELLLNRATSGKGFLISSEGGQTFPARLEIRVAGEPEIDVVLRTAVGSFATIVFGQSTVHVSGDWTEISVHSTTTSEALNDTVVEAISDGAVVARLELTSIRAPRLRYSGRFQCRLATDPDSFDEPWGENSSFGMYAVQGPSIATPDEPPLDRIIRLHDPVAMRPFSEPIGAMVTAVEVQVGGAPASFTAGDAVLGMPVRFGPNGKFESQNGAFAQTGLEPISDFEFHIGTRFSGRSAPAVPRIGSNPPGSTAPYADGFFRLDEVGPWHPRDFGYVDSTWAQHAVAVTTAKLADLSAQVPANAAEARIRDRRLQEHSKNLGNIQFCMRMVERYSGFIDRDLQISPGDSAVLSALATHSMFAFRAEFFNFDTDAQCGTITGTVSGA